MIRFPGLVIAVCVAAALFTSSPASALTLVQTVNLPEQIVVGPSTSSFTDPALDLIVLFNQFDPSLGKLNSVTFDFDTDFQATIEVLTGVGGGAGFVGGNIDVNGIIFTGTGGGAGAGGPASGSPYFGLFEADAFSILDPSINPAAFDQFIGTGVAAITWDMTPGINASPDPDNLVQTTLTLLGTSTVTVTYDFTPIPEPATATLLLMLLGPALRRRRRA